jgi:putative transcriptional regulator
MANAKPQLQGQLLLDAGDLGGSCFARSVVLICQHNAEGAFGLILSEPAGKIFGEAVNLDLPDMLKEHPLFVGGPVQPTALSYLLSDDFLPEANVFPNLSLGHSLEELVELGNSFSTTRRVRVFAGYAGWGPGQLESELRRKSWVVCPATLEIVFDPDPTSLWSRLIRRLGGWRNIILSQVPEDPSRN